MSEESGTFIGRAGDRFDGVNEIGVLRGGGIGDLMFAVPAMAALQAAYPDARLTLLGTPVHRAVLGDGRGPVDEVVVLPFAEGVRPGHEDPALTAAFLSTMRQRCFDLAVQVHGGGGFSNGFLLEMGARHTVGTRAPDAVALERNLPYRYYQHEVLRALEVVGLAGAPAGPLEARLSVSADERENARLRRTASRLLTIHPGATDPRRRWPADRFGAVAAGAAADGWQVVVVGDESDRAAGESIVEAAGSPRVTSLAGELNMSGLFGMLAESTVMVGNDSGPRHLAAAVGTPTVGLYWVGNCLNAGPLGRGLHRVLLGWTTRCPECGVDVTQVGWTAERCSHDPSYLLDIGVDEVLTEVQALAAGV